MDDITRVCRKCGQEKPLEEFVKDKTRELGYSYTCKHCRREHACKYRADNHEKVLERTRKWRVDNPEKVREYDRKYRADNHEKILEYGRKHYAENSERYKKYSRKWQAANPEKVRETRRYKREILSDGYLRRQLKQRNLPVTPETIDYKRIQLKLYREIKKQQNDERD
ncbi:hypothetical protein [Barnesiella intestinihominis]|jgi:hypothetical protein|uniref:hypothetical protein n=1 Tax=Barnesiella intestinihominis TaxID=487174 RepID=UPI0039676AA1